MPGSILGGDFPGAWVAATVGVGVGERAGQVSPLCHCFHPASSGIPICGFGAKPVPQCFSFCQAWGISASGSCLLCSISNYGCLLNVFQKALSLPKERKSMLSAQPCKLTIEAITTPPPMVKQEGRNRGPPGACGPFEPTLWG